MLKVPKAKKMSSGNYYINMRLGGQSVSITRPTEREAIRAAQLLKAEYRNGKRLETDVKNLTLREAIDKYIAVRSNVLSPSTVRGYRTIQSTRFKSIMDRPISSIKNWQGVVNAEAATCSAKTLKNAYLFIRSVLHDCGEDHPMVRLPQVVQAERPYLDPEQIPAFLAAVKGRSCEMAALLALHSLRRSELLALDKSSIDTERGIIKVKGALVRDESGNMVLKKENKNTYSARTVPIMIPRLVDLVKDAPEGRLVTTKPNNLLRNINCACRSAGLPEVGVHGLRHSFASLSYHLGLPERECTDLGGWSDINTMHKIYTHLSEKDKEKAANKMAIYYQLLSKSEENANRNAN